MFCWKGNCANSKTHRHLVVDLDGMVVPKYQVVSRASCKLLTLAWEQRWDAILRRCEIYPSECFTITEHSGRTALSLSTFTSASEGCPIEVARAILQANRHAIVVADHQSYTPLHNIALFRGGDELMSLFCDTALMVEQELKGRGHLPTPSRTSPLYLAAKRNAPLSTLRTLLRTRSRSSWIAPFTGGEPYWEDPQQTLDICSSPLEILLRGRTSSFVGISDITKQQMKAMVLELLLNEPLFCWEEANISVLDQHDEVAIHLWAKCLLLLQEPIRHFVPPEDNDQLQQTFCSGLIHTISSLRVPVPFLLQMAVDLFQDQQIIQNDETGLLPLHHILLAKHPYATQRLLDILLASNNAQYPLKQLQKALSIALKVGIKWDDGLEQIVMVNSDVLTVVDAHTNLVPAFLAASYNASVDTIFNLLREEPHVVVTMRSSKAL